MKDKFYVGRVWNPVTGRTGAAVYFDLDEIAHMTLLGPTSCGKGATIELPNLLGDGLRDVNVVSIDPTGQNFAVAGRWRGTFSNVQPLNPFHLHGFGDVGCNPLLSVETFEQAMAVGEAMLEVKPAAHEPFWGESGQGLIGGVVLAVVKDSKAKRTPSLEMVREILTCDLEGFAAHMEQEGDFQLQSLLSQYQKENRTIDSIKQHVNNATKWLLSEAISKSLAVEKGIDWTQLKQGGRPLSVFVILDADKLVTFAPWLRLIIVSALNTLYRLGGVDGRKTLFMLSEFPALGRMGAVISGLGQGRKYGVRFAPMVCQDSGQLAAIYGRENWTTIIGNSGCLLAFAPAPCDNETAEFLSKAAGSHWVPSISASDDPHGGGCRINVGEREERVWSPDKIRGLPKFHGLVFRDGAQPLAVWCPRYFRPDEFPELRNRFDADPYHPSPAPSPASTRPRRKVAALAAASAAVIVGGGLWLSNAAGSNPTWRTDDKPVVRVDPAKPNPPAHGSPPSHKPQHVTRRY